MGKKQGPVRTVVFEVQTVSFCFSFFDEFWPIHQYEVMIRSRRNEKEMKEHEEEQRLEGFQLVIRYQTKTKTKLSLSNIRNI